MGVGEAVDSKQESYDDGEEWRTEVEDEVGFQPFQKQYSFEQLRESKHDVFLIRIGKRPEFRSYLSYGHWHQVFPNTIRGIIRNDYSYFEY